MDWSLISYDSSLREEKKERKKERKIQTIQIISLWIMIERMTISSLTNKQINGKDAKFENYLHKLAF